MTFYFIPAWYTPNRPWYDNTDVWYRGSTIHQFDDTINQLKMFDYAGEDSRLMVMNYMPNLRYFTHRYDLYEIPVWSVFDAIQGTTAVKQRMVDFKELNWPKGIEFIYTPFLVVARLAKQVIATIEFGEDGQLIWINRFEQGQRLKRYVFDDRGFLSSILYYKDGQDHYQDYLDLSGQWQIREYLLPDDCHVDIAEGTVMSFSKKRYRSIEEVVKEVMLLQLVKQERPGDWLVIASHPAHNDLLLGAKGRRQIILSYYQNRVLVDHHLSLLKHLSQADLVVADTQAKTDLLANYGIGQVLHLPLFDTRLRLGTSQRLKELIIYFLVDELPKDELSDYLDDIFETMRVNPQIHVTFVTYDGDGQARENCYQWLENRLGEEQAPYLFFENEEQSKMFEAIEDEEPPRSRVQFLHLGTELHIQKVLETARLIIDLREEPDLYTQIAGISAGIPQINRTDSEFVVHLQNGFIVKGAADLLIALDYYLTELANWNKSLVFAVQKIEAYTSGRLVKRLIRKLTYHE